MRLATPILAAAVAVFFAAPAFADESGAIPTISVSGTGTVSAAPDMATITTGVVSQGGTARAALDQNNAAMSNLIETLKTAGIENRDIQTSNFSVQPNYVHSNDRDSDGYSRPPKIEGYEVSNSVAIRVRDLDALGTILDRVVSAGSNTISGISFSVKDTKALLQQARIAAVKDATAKAETLTGAAGVSLGTLRNISETSGDSPRPVMFRQMAVASEANQVPIQGGELNYSVQVSVTWALNQVLAE